MNALAKNGNLFYPQKDKSEISFAGREVILDPNCDGLVLKWYDGENLDKNYKDINDNYKIRTVKHHLYNTPSIPSIPSEKTKCKVIAEMFMNGKKYLYLVNEATNLGFGSTNYDSQASNIEYWIDPDYVQLLDSNYSVQISNQKIIKATKNGIEFYPENAPESNTSLVGKKVTVLTAPEKYIDYSSERESEFQKYSYYFRNDSYNRANGFGIDRATDYWYFNDKKPYTLTIIGEAEYNGKKYIVPDSKLEDRSAASYEDYKWVEKNNSIVLLQYYVGWSEASGAQYAYFPLWADVNCPYIKIQD